MVEIKARCWSRSAFNFRSFLRLWTPAKPHECTCRKWCKTTSTHLFAPVPQILPLSPLADLNLNDTTFLPAKQWQRIAEKEVRKWGTRWKLPDRILEGLLQWVQHQIVLHHEALQADQQDLPRQISQDLRTLKGLVLTPADHFPHSLHVACPLLSMFCWIRPSWTARYLNDALLECHPFLPISSLDFSRYVRSTDDIIGDAIGLFLCRLLVFCRSPARIFVKPDRSLLAIVAGMHG